MHFINVYFGPRCHMLKTNFDFVEQRDECVWWREGMPDNITLSFSLDNSSVFLWPAFYSCGWRKPLPYLDLWCFRVKSKVWLKVLRAICLFGHITITKSSCQIYRGQPYERISSILVRSTLGVISSVKLTIIISFFFSFLSQSMLV